MAPCLIRFQKFRRGLDVALFPKFEKISDQSAKNLHVTGKIDPTFGWHPVDELHGSYSGPEVGFEEVEPGHQTAGGLARDNLRERTESGPRRTC